MSDSIILGITGLVLATITGILFFVSLLSWIVFFSFDGVTKSVPLFRWIVSGTLASDWGVRVAFVGLDVEQNAIRLAVDGTTVEPEQWVVVQAYEKPFISVLWLGTLVLLAGVALSVRRRAQET